MDKARHLLILVCAIMITSVVGCTNSNKKDVQPLLDKISHSPESELPGLL